MTDIFIGKWHDLNPKYYLDMLRMYAQVGWIGGEEVYVHGVSQFKIGLSDDYLLSHLQRNGLKTVSYFISDSKEWEEFVNSAYAPAYKGGKDFRAPDAELYTMREFAKVRATDPNYIRKVSEKTGLSEFDINAILTAYDPSGCKRLVVDGGHRAVILNNEKEKRTPQAIVYECRGDAIDTVFPSDFQHLKRMARAEKANAKANAASDM